MPLHSNRFLDADGFRALLRVAGERRRVTARRDRFLFYFLGRTGLRVSEALALRDGDFWFPPPASSVPAFVRVRTLKRRGAPTHDEVLLDRATARATRHYLNNILHALLTVDQRLQIGPQLPVFPRRSRTDALVRPLTRQAVWNLFRFYAARAGLPRSLVVHSLRHYRGTVLYQTTRDLAFTRAQLRHRRLETTRAYLHVSPSRVRRYLEQLEGTHET